MIKKCKLNLPILKVAYNIKKKIDYQNKEISFKSNLKQTEYHKNLVIKQLICIEIGI